MAEQTITILNKQNLDIAKIASKEESHCIINGICVTPDATYATDGHRLVKVDRPKITSEAVPDDYEAIKGNVIVQRDDALQLSKLLNKDPKLPIERGALIERRDAKVFGTVLSNGRTVVMKSPSLTGKFPDVEAVWPKGEPTVRVAVNAKYLAEILTLSAGLNPFATIEFYPSPDGAANPMGVVMVRSKGEEEQNFTACLAPVRTDA